MEPSGSIATIKARTVGQSELNSTDLLFYLASLPAIQEKQEVNSEKGLISYSSKLIEILTGDFPNAEVFLSIHTWIYFYFYFHSLVISVKGIVRSMAVKIMDLQSVFSLSNTSKIM